MGLGRWVSHSDTSSTHKDVLLVILHKRGFLQVLIGRGPSQQSVDSEDVAEDYFAGFVSQNF